MYLCLRYILLFWSQAACPCPPSGRVQLKSIPLNVEFCSAEWTKRQISRRDQDKYELRGSNCRISIGHMIQFLSANGAYSKQGTILVRRKMNIWAQGKIRLVAQVQMINPLKKKRRLLFLKTQLVPRSKHFSSRL
jgi:hypothetical protein